jgi:hypothetical protein
MLLPDPESEVSTNEQRYRLSAWLILRRYREDILSVLLHHVKRLERVWNVDRGLRGSEVKLK